jgi:nitrate reductase NapD
VHTAPDRADLCARDIEAMPGAEIHGRSDNGRFVVVVEDTATRRASEIIMDIHQIPGVLSVTLTYHHFEDAAEAQAPIHAQSPTQSGAQTHDHL